MPGARKNAPKAPSPDAPDSPDRFTFRARHRLAHNLQFQAVYGAKVRKSAGPLTIFALPNDRGHPRLGLSVGRRVGTAPKRNAIKRLLREAFRLMQHELPAPPSPSVSANATAGYDLVINVGPHEVLDLPEYRRLLAECAAGIHKVWTRRLAESGS